MLEEAEFTSETESSPESASGELAVARLIIERAADAIFLLDEEGRATLANPSAEEMFGWSFAELKGKKLHDIIHYQHADGSPFPMDECPLGNVFVTGRSLRFHEDLFFRRGGIPVHVTCSNAAIVEKGEVRGGVLIVRDVSERHRIERHRQLLLNELNHRVKNTLTIVQALAHQTLVGEDLTAARNAFEARLASLASAHDLLTAHDWTGASLIDLLRAAARPFTGDQPRLILSGPDIALPAQTAVALSMIVHELATNATKYGSLSVPRGRVAVEWRVEEEGDERRLLLLWEERGGPEVREPEERGFGSRLIEQGLAAELGGDVSMEFRREGLVCSVRAALPNAQ